jgi:hypothetical protein
MTPDRAARYGCSGRFTGVVGCGTRTTRDRSDFSLAPAYRPRRRAVAQRGPAGSRVPITAHHRSGPVIGPRFTMLGIDPRGHLQLTKHTERQIRLRPRDCRVRRPAFGVEIRCGSFEHSAINDIAGSQVGSQQRQAPGYVRPQRTLIFAGERHSGLLPATSGDGPGLIHTEEVTGSIPVSPTT